MAKLETLGEVLSTDVLVIGGGPSGLWAAKKAAEMGAKVILVDKAGQDSGGKCYLSSGGMIAPQRGENIDNFVKEMVYFGDGLYEQDVLEEVFKAQTERMEDYERMGMKFMRDKGGKLIGNPQRGLDFIKCYIGAPFGYGGEAMVSCLINEMERLGVRRLGRVLISELLQNSTGAIVGALGFDCRSGGFYTLKAKAVVLALGGSGFKTSYGSNTDSGLGHQMALDTGAKLRNMEFGAVWNVPRLFSWEGQTWLLPLGARFLDNQGRPFLDKYSPKLKYKIDCNFIMRALAMEARKGNGPFNFDPSPLKPEDVKLMTPEAGWTKLNHEKLLAKGINFFKDQTEWEPAAAGASTPRGGIATELKGSAGVPGLYACGAIRNLDPGVYMGGWSLGTCPVLGYWAGESAANYISSVEEPQLNEVEVLERYKKMYAPMGKTGIDPEEMLKTFQSIIFKDDVWLLKSESSLKRTLNALENLKEKLPLMVSKDFHYLKYLREVKSLFLVAELFVRSSLARTESRSTHYREDFPKRDDSSWMKWIMISKDKEKFKLETKQVPLEKYKFKPTRFYSDNFVNPKN